MQFLGTYPKHLDPLSPPPIFGNQILGKFVIGQGQHLPPPYETFDLTT